MLHFLPFQSACCHLVFQESVLNYRLDPLGIVDGFTAEVGASGTFCPTHLTLPVEVSFYSVSDDNAPSPYMASTFVFSARISQLSISHLGFRFALECMRLFLRESFKN